MRQERRLASGLLLREATSIDAVDTHPSRAPLIPERGNDQVQVLDRYALFVLLGHDAALHVESMVVRHGLIARLVPLQVVSVRVESLLLPGGLDAVLAALLVVVLDLTLAVVTGHEAVAFRGLLDLVY